MRPFVYQGHALTALATARKNGQKRALVVMATGLGKTVVCGFDLKRLLEKESGRVLFLSHDTNINTQARKTFEKMLGKTYSHGNFNGKEKHLHRVDFLYATLQTMANHRESFCHREFKYVVLDEAHHGEAATFKPTLEYFQPDFFLAVTATPERGDNKDITEFFGEPVYRLGVFEALAKKYLCKVDYRLMTDEIQNLEVLDTPIGKLSISELNRRVFIPKRDEEIARTIAEKIKDVKSPRVMIFCSSIEHAERMAALMPHAAVLHSKMKDKKEVQRRLDAFRTGEIDTVLTVDMLNEGIDVPEANVLVFLRSTSSRTIFLQQLGRGLRKLLGKAGVLVLDFVANCERIEMIDWLIEGTKRELARVVSDRFEAGEIGADGDSIRDVIHLDIEGSEFDERLVRLVQVVSEVKEGYTEEDVLAQIRILAEKLGRVPTARDARLASEAGEMATQSTIDRMFGSWNAALERAGLKTTRQIIHATPQQMKVRLYELYRHLGRVPRPTDVDDARLQFQLPGQKVFRKEFGTWDEVLAAAGIIRDDSAEKEQRKQEVSKLLRSLAAEEGLEFVTKRQVDIWCAEGRCPSSGTIAGLFQGWNPALVAAGMRLNMRRDVVTREDAIKQIQMISDELGHTPRMREVDPFYREGRCVSASSMMKAIGGTYEDLLREAGLSLNRGHSLDELIVMLQQYAELIGETPRVKRMKVDAKTGICLGPWVYIERFGAWSAALEAAGLK